MALLDEQVNIQAGNPLCSGTGFKLIRGSSDGLRAYLLSTESALRDDLPDQRRLTVVESSDCPVLRTGRIHFDALYAMANEEARQNAVSMIRDDDYRHGKSIDADVFITGEKWNYVWTRDLAYALYLGLAGYDTERAIHSLLFKASTFKESVSTSFSHQIVQDTGTGGSYPVSTDRVVWALGVSQVLTFLSGEERIAFIRKVYPYLRDTLEQDRRLVFDPVDGLYRGEHSFLDWREQTYPAWTADDVRAIAMSKALSVNIAMYYMLITSAGFASQLGHMHEHERYLSWASVLKEAINMSFYDPEAELYRTYLLSEDGIYYHVPKRYDLLGQALAILLGVSDDERSRRMIEAYPVGPHGPAVIWPLEANVPIYHNRGIWPFVTALWVKAAVLIRNSAAVDAGSQSLVELAARNLSNMENFDFVTGTASVTRGSVVGPTLNSRRQLWSVAGYLSLVQDIIFGINITEEGMRLQPGLTAFMRKEWFGMSDAIRLKGFKYLTALHDITIHLPQSDMGDTGFLSVEQVRLNGSNVTDQVVSAAAMSERNTWEVYLAFPRCKPGTIKQVVVSDERQLYTPQAPSWPGDAPAITHVDGLVHLQFEHALPDGIVIDVYRNGQLAASGLRQTHWVDNHSIDHAMKRYAYYLVARDDQTGYLSHSTPSVSSTTAVPALRLSPDKLQATGGTIASGQIAQWGKPEDVILSDVFTVTTPGAYYLQVVFSNGSGPINTGISCAVKKLELLDATGGEVVQSAYVIMPQSGTWEREDLSNPLVSRLQEGMRYQLRLSEDEISHNMSYLNSNEGYTRNPGGGALPHNRIRVFALQVECQEALS